MINLTQKAFSIASMLGLLSLLLSPFFDGKATVRAALSSPLTPRAYSGWLAEHGALYDRKAFLGPDGRVAVHWSVGGANKLLHLAVAVEGASGWLGFGIAEAGGMPGSDIVLFEAATDDSVEDLYALRDGAPLRDECQDWKLVRSIVVVGDGDGGEDGDFLLFEATRALSTGDRQDRELKDDSVVGTPAHPVIAAWGNSTRMSYHGDARATGFIRFFGAQDSEQLSVEPRLDGDATSEITNEEVPTVGTFDIMTGNYIIPTNETTYEEFCFHLDDFTDADGIDAEKEVHMFQVDHLPDPNTIGLVHHIILFASKTDNACDTWKVQPLYLWAPGSDSFVLPENVGVRLGGGGYRSFYLQVHYDNRKNIPNKVDNSGVRVSYTTEPREHEAGIIQVADPMTSLTGEPIDSGSDDDGEPPFVRRYDFTCPSSCTLSHLTNKVTVFQELLHMHESGAKMTNTQVRNENEVVHEQFVDYYNFDTSGGFTPVQRPFDLEPGDEIRTSCYYRVDGADAGRVFGLGSRDEMCIAYLFYYPVNENFHGICGAGVGQFDPNCAATHSNASVADEEGLGRSFGVSSGECASVKDEGENVPDGNASDDSSGGSIDDSSGGSIDDSSGGSIDDSSGGSIDDSSGGSIDDSSGGSIVWSRCKAYILVCIFASYLLI